jgi:hypothetical protein
MHQHRLYLVVSVVRDGDTRRADFPRDLRQKIVPCSPRRCLDSNVVGFRNTTYVGSPYRKWNAPLLSNLLHESSLLNAARSPQLVIERRTVKPETNPRLKMSKNMEQGQ